MTRPPLWFCRTLVLFLFSFTVRAEPFTPLDLKPFVGPSSFDYIKVPWALPRGRHVFDGVPFQIDGAILLFANNLPQQTNPGRQIVEPIAVNTAFCQLHLLAAGQMTAPDGTAIAKFILNYDDGTTNALEVRYGDH